MADSNSVELGVCALKHCDGSNKMWGRETERKEYVRKPKEGEMLILLYIL